MIGKRYLNLTINEKTEKELSNIKEHLNLPDDISVFRLAIALYSKLLDDKKAGRELISHERNGRRKYKLDFAKGSR